MIQKAIQVGFLHFYCLTLWEFHASEIQYKLMAHAVYFAQMISSAMNELLVEFGLAADAAATCEAFE